MKVYRFSVGEKVPSLDSGALLLGTFDGVHRGHEALVNAAKEALVKELAVLLFDGNPADSLGNGKSHRVLTSLEDKLARFDVLGVDKAYLIHIDKVFFALSPQTFLERVLTPLRPALIVVGQDYTFGYQGAGKVKDLSAIFPTLSVPLLSDERGKLSTQRIVHEIERGEVALAAHDLGRSYEIKGLVSHGLQNGRRLGFPTANLLLSTPYVIPKEGVYRGHAYSRGILYPALINVGKNPTIGVLHHPVIESYLAGLSHEIYGETLYVGFDSFLREEKKFNSLAELKAQIEKDKLALQKVGI